MVENVERHLHEGKTPVRGGDRGARELVGPIIAMTITLAAVYAPIGIQGGLTGALFREFAFTLAGAVIVSGVVALTLSPMMGSKLLRAGRRRARLRRLDQPPLRRRARSATRALLDGDARVPPGRARRCGRSSSLLIVPFYMFSQKELAPTEDQGVVFGIVQAAPNATLDQTKLFADQVARRLPRRSRRPTSTSRSRRPTGGFGGMVTKPWSERKKTHRSSSRSRSSGKLVEDPGRARHPADAAGAAGRRQLPGRVRRSPRRPSREQLVEFAEPARAARRSRAACSCSPTPT